MLTPEKYTDYNTSLFKISAMIIKTLLDNGPMMYNEVLNSVEIKLGENSKFEFQNALSFLYLLDKIDYYCESDILRLVK